MQKNKRSLLAFALAAALMLPAVPAAAQEDSETQDNMTLESDDTVDTAEDTAEQLTQLDDSEETASPSITESVSNQTYTIDADSVLKIENTSEDELVLSDCTFVISGSDEALTETELENEGKILVTGNVKFENCTFTVKDVTSSYTGESVLLCSDAVVDFENCTVEQSDSQAAFISVVDGSSVSFDKLTFKAENQQESVFVENGGKIAFKECEIEIDGVDTNDAVFVIASGADLLSSAGEDSSQAAASMTFEDSQIAAGNLGGSLFYGQQSDSALDLKNTTITVDQAENVFSSLVLTMENSTVTASEAGALILNGGTIENSTLTLSNGGMLTINGDLAVIDSTLEIDPVSTDAAELNTTIVSGAVLSVSGEKSSVILGMTDVEDGASIEDEAGAVSYTKSTEESSDDSDEKDDSQDSDEKTEGDSTDGTTKDEGTDTDSGTVTVPGEQQPTDQEEPEVSITKINIQFIDIETDREIKTAVSEDMDDFVSVQDFVYNYPKGINGYDYVKYEYESDETAGTVDIQLYYQAKEKYSVSVNYVCEGSTVPIHFSNVLTGLTEGETYDVSKFNAIDISGYTYVRTEGSLTGTAGGSNHAIQVTCIYKKNANTADKNDVSMHPDKGENVHTGSQTNTGLYVGIFAGAAAVVALIAFLLFKNKKKQA